ncbi:hypothetical protein PAXRUDRAFT_546916 [Paxillus rubicundulus Ve08.2h10]|uniref:Uncharacterized protein n=1 Tax=Paxillus rubicundulus Ve08.2h10 TaxID=930991 RepID=A0A0D0D7Q9_9AGAM|nr:hypothetical protein PAXRUDRAFT_546916 [Paxillus rubicundulus Ve08.2h10]
MQPVPSPMIARWRFHSQGPGFPYTFFRLVHKGSALISQLTEEAPRITTGNHVATMTVQNWDNIFSGVIFDYAAINETLVSLTTTRPFVDCSPHDVTYVYRTKLTCKHWCDGRRCHRWPVGPRCDRARNCLLPSKTTR